MLKRMVLQAVILIGFILPGHAGAQQLTLSVKSPLDNGNVVERDFVEGTVSDPRASVSVIVHPMEVGDYWVQQNVNVRKNGTWRVQIHIGRPGAVDAGKRFEIRAVANPNTALREGTKLSTWPQVQAQSDIIEVTRR